MNYDMKKKSSIPKIFQNKGKNLKINFINTKNYNSEKRNTKDQNLDIRNTKSNIFETKDTRSNNLDIKNIQCNIFDMKNIKANNIKNRKDNTYDIKDSNNLSKKKSKVKINKRENNKQKKTKILSSKSLIIFLITIFLVILLFISSFSLGKQLTNVDIDTTAQIANPILIVENNPAIDINNKNTKGYYDFKVKNYDELNEINQIPLKYSIEILTKTDDSISFKLYKDDQEIQLKNNKTDEMIMKSNEKQEENYKLEILYDSGKSVTSENILEQVQIKVHSEQIKL